MKRKLNPREKVMIVLLAVLAIVAYRFIGGDGIGFGGSPQEEKPAKDFGEPPVVRMDLLELDREGFDPAGRNLFAYYVPPPPPRKAPPRVAPPPRKPPPPRQQPAPPPPQREVKPRAPRPDFSYLGYFGPKDARIAAFDTGSEVYVAREGDLVGKQYKLVAFKHEAVELAYTDPRWEGQTTELQKAGAK